MAVPRSSRWSTALLAPLTILAWLAVVLVAGWLLSHVTRALMTIVFSAVIAYALTPVVRLLNRFVPRAVAVAIAFLVGFVVVFGLLGIVVVTAATQVQTLVGHLPAYASEARQLEPHVLGVVKPWGITITK
ncbi:MAG: AI-2E family transporter, partial [Candidatus Dormibacteraceae bacterium]